MLAHQDTVVHSHQAPLLHLHAELALAPGVARPQLGRPRVVIQHHRPLHWDPGLFHCHVHRQIEQLGVPVLHPTLGEEEPDQVPAGHALAHYHRLVLNVRGQALGVHLQRYPRHNRPALLTAVVVVVVVVVNLSRLVRLAGQLGDFGDLNRNVEILECEGVSHRDKS